MNWYEEGLKKYADFRGRAHRKEFWCFAFAVVGNALIICSIFGLMIGVLYAIAVFSPFLASLSRRLHDTGRSGWWLFIMLFPVLGAAVLLKFATEKSVPNPNR